MEKTPTIKMVETPKTEAEITQEFLEEYRKLVIKYKRDFQIPPPNIITVSFAPPEKINQIVLK